MSTLNRIFPHFQWHKLVTRQDGSLSNGSLAFDNRERVRGNKMAEPLVFLCPSAWDPLHLPPSAGHLARTAWSWVSHCPSSVGTRIHFRNHVHRRDMAPRDSSWRRGDGGSCFLLWGHGSKFMSFCAACLLHLLYSSNSESRKEEQSASFQEDSEMPRPHWCTVHRNPGVSMILVGR